MTRNSWKIPEHCLHCLLRFSSRCPFQTAARHPSKACRAAPGPPHTALRTRHFSFLADLAESAATACMCVASGACRQANELADPRERPALEAAGPFAQGQWAEPRALFAHSAVPRADHVAGQVMKVAMVVKLVPSQPSTVLQRRLNGGIYSHVSTPRTVVLVFTCCRTRSAFPRRPWNQYN